MHSTYARNMSEVIYRVIAPEGLQEIILAEQARLRSDNPELEVRVAEAERGWLDQALSIMGDLANLAGLITFVEWCVTKFRMRAKEISARKDAPGKEEPLKFLVIGPNGLPKMVLIEPGDDAAQIRKQISHALDPSQS